MLAIRGWIELPSPQRFDEKAVALVHVEEVTLADAPSRRMAETVVAPIEGVRDRIPFDLRVEDACFTSASYIVTAEVRHRAEAGLCRGDFLSTEAHPWHPGADQGGLRIRVDRI